MRDTGAESMSCPVPGTTLAACGGEGQGFWARLAAGMIVTSEQDVLCRRPALAQVLRRFAAVDADEVHFTYIDGNTWYSVRVRSEPSDDGHHRVELIAAPRARIWGLSAKELDVLTLIACGLTNRQIAQRLSISEKTVGTHVEHLLSKSRQRSRGAIAALASERALLRFPVPGGCVDGLPQLAVVALTAAVADPPTAAVADASRTGGGVAPHRVTRRPRFRLGAVYPDTVTGEDMRRGAQLAVELVNARGGIAGEPVELVTVTAADTDGDAVADRFAELAAAHVTALSAVHLPGASTVDRMLDLARDTNLPFLHSLGSGSAVRAPSRPAGVSNVFQLCTGPDVYLPALRRFLADTEGLLLRKRDRGHRPVRLVVLVDGLVAAPGAPASGVAEAFVHEQVTVRTAAERERAVAALRDDPPDAVYLHLFERDALCGVLDALFAAEAFTLVFAAWLPGTFGFPIERYEGLCWLSDVGRHDDPVSATFERQFERRFGVRPGLDAGLQHDCVRILAQSWRAAGLSHSPRAVQDEIRNAPYRGVNGAYYFDTPGQAVLAVPRDTSDMSLGQPTVISQVRQGTSRPIWPPSIAERGPRLPHQDPPGRRLGGRGL